MAAVEDWLMSLAHYVKNEVGTQVEGRVFRPELPKGEDEHMPRGCVILTKGGGGHMFGQTRMEAFDHLVDIVCYGSTRQDATTVGDSVEYALHTLTRQTLDGVVLHWARIAGGVKSHIDEKTEWPMAIVTAQVMHSYP